MWDNNDAQLIIDGMEKLGLNPQDLKYILISHGHGDHYGGAQYLKDKYNAKVFMSNTDFYYMNNTFDGANGSRSPKCTVDEFLTDGQQITLGDTTNPFYLGQKGIDNYLNNLSLEIDRAIANSIK